MPTRGGSVHVVTTRRHYKDKVYETTLLRRSYREGGKVKSETVGNLSHLPPEAIAAIRQVLKGQTLVTATSHAEIGRSLPHGDVALVWAMARQLGLPALLGDAGRQRDLALALIVARVLRPASKLATTRWWHDTTLAAIWALPTPPPTRSTPRWTGFKAARTTSSGPWPVGTCSRVGWPTTTCRRHMWRATTASWPPGATPATRRSARTRSSTGCSPTPTAARWPWRSWRATPPIRPPSPRWSSASAAGSSSPSWSWSATAA